MLTGIGVVALIVGFAIYFNNPELNKSSPENIYSFFGMSKKTFKMTTGKLYKERRIEFTPAGIKLAEQ